MITQKPVILFPLLMRSVICLPTAIIPGRFDEVIISRLRFNHLSLSKQPAKRISAREENAVPERGLLQVLVTLGANHVSQGEQGLSPAPRKEERMKKVGQCSIS